MSGRVRRAVVVGSTMGIALLIGTGPAFAHIDPDPLAIESGTTASVSFGVEHGCEGSPTIGLDFQVPDGVTDAQPDDKDGWTTAVAGDVVSFSDGNLDPETPDKFSITFTAPDEAGTIYFPVVQKCETGEIAWIEIPAGGASEPENPAPAITITDGPPTAEDLESDHDDEEATEETGDDGHHGDGADGHDDDSNTGVIVGIAIAVVVIGAGAAVLITRRRKGTPST